MGNNYKKKSKKIKAYQWHGHNHPDNHNQLNRDISKDKPTDTHGVFEVSPNPGADTQKVNPTDWLVYNEEGSEDHPLGFNDTDFAETYEETKP